MDILNELKYQFGGTKAVEEAARDGTLNPQALKPNFVQSLFGTSQADLERARYQGDLQRFNESELADQAEQYGIDIKQTGRGKLTRGEIRSQIANAQQIKELNTQYRALGGTGEIGSDITAGALGSLIRDQKDTNETARTLKAQNLAYNNPQARDERETRDRRYFDSQKMLLQDRIDAREAKAQEFEYQKMRDRKEDMRYNEEMARLDAKDRRMAMQSLAAGLASLGAAFAM